MRPWESHCKLKPHEHQILQPIFQYPVKFKIIQNVLGIPGSDHHHRPKIQGLSLSMGVKVSLLNTFFGMSYMKY